MSKVKDKVFIPVIFFLVIQLFVSSEVFWFIGLVCALYFLFQDRFNFVVPFKEYKMLFLFIIWGIITGVFIIGKKDTSFRDYLRDIFYYSTPIIYIYIGACYARLKISTSKLLNSFIISSAVISLFYIIRIAQQGAAFLASSDIHGWRALSGGGAIVIGVSLAIHLSGIIDPEERLPSICSGVCFVISGLFFVLSLSRTNLLIIVIMTLVLSLKRENGRKKVGRFMLVILAIITFIVLSAFLLPESMVKEYSMKVLKSFIEISRSNEWNAYTIQNNWRGYENYCAYEQWKNSSLIEQLIGSGFGRRIYVGDYAYRFLGQLYSDGTPANSIAVLHNGYSTQLIKLGLLGVVLYVCFYFSVIKNAWKLTVTTKSVESRLMLAVAITLLVQTFFLNGLFRDYCYYPVIVLIGFSSYRSLFMQDECRVLI